MITREEKETRIELQAPTRRKVVETGERINPIFTQDPSYVPKGSQHFQK